MGYEQIVALFLLFAEAFRRHSKEASDEGRTELARLFLRAVVLTSDYVNELEKIFAECEEERNRMDKG